MPNDGASPQPNQNNIRLTGAGGGGAWYGTNATILDLRYVSGDQNAKIETRGRGTLEIDHLTIKDGGSSNPTPMVHTTNTSLAIHESTFIMSGSVAQDAIVLGGTDTAVGGGVNAPFQGYTTRIVNNHFRGGNRGLYGLNYANAVLFQGNSFQANTGTVAIEFGERQRELAEIQSQAYERAQEVRGEADAEATTIYAGAYSRDPDFYAFTKSLETYEATMDESTLFVLGTDNELLRFVKRSR